MMHRLIYAALATAGLVAACGGGIGGTGAPVGNGTLRVGLTDAPACGFDHVYVTVSKVRVHQSADAGDGESGWSEVVLNPAQRVDLLTLTNGVVRTLGQTTLPAGTYTQARLVLAPNNSASPMANAVVPTGGTETALDVPSGVQSGIKVPLNVVVPADKVADVVLDFDACKSVVRRGNSGQYNLKPVVRAVTVLSEAGQRVEGHVAASAASGAQVSVQQNGTPVKATQPDSTGRFVLYPVPTGSYDLVITAPNRATAVVTGVAVAASAPTVVNTAQAPITPPISSVQTITGSVNPATATVRALQTFNGGPTVEVAWGSVNATSGAFSFQLPVAAPVKVAYNPSILNFVADPTAAAKYTLEAAAGGAVKTQAIDVSGSVPPVSFTFP